VPLCVAAALCVCMSVCVVVPVCVCRRAYRRERQCVLVCAAVCCSALHCVGCAAESEACCGCRWRQSHSSGGDAQEFEKRLWCCLMTRRAARAVSSRRGPPTLFWLRCVCVDVHDVRLCVYSTSRLSSLCCCYACVSLAAERC
jgi:hypothetical protein